jgi:8-oxo-dGTP pyrophosphatase MutT (NUDIX family)
MIETGCHPVRVRRSSRLIVVDAEGRVLLFKNEDPGFFRADLPRASDGRGIYWNTPGGGVEGEETFEEAARRELREETGIVGVEPGACILEQTVHGPGVAHHERYFLVRVPANAVVVDEIGDTASAVYRGYRWWTVAELDASDEAFLPAGLAGLVRAVL